MFKYEGTNLNDKEEGLGNVLCDRIESISSLLLFNTAQHPYKAQELRDPLEDLDFKKTKKSSNMLEEGRDCNDVLPQLSALNKALSKAGFAIVASSLQECLAHPDSDGTSDVASLEKLFLSLA